MQSITKMQIRTMDHMMDAWEEQIKSPNPMTGSPVGDAVEAEVLAQRQPAGRGRFPTGGGKSLTVLDAVCGAVAEGMRRRYVVLGQGRQAI
jgi:hypothetical protein